MTNWDVAKAHMPKGRDTEEERLREHRGTLLIPVHASGDRKPEVPSIKM